MLTPALSASTLGGGTGKCNPKCNKAGRQGRAGHAGEATLARLRPCSRSVSICGAACVCDNLAPLLRTLSSELRESQRSSAGKRHHVVFAECCHFSAMLLLPGIAIALHYRWHCDACPSNMSKAGNLCCITSCSSRGHCRCSGMCSGPPTDMKANTIAVVKVVRFMWWCKYVLQCALSRCYAAHALHPGLAAGRAQHTCPQAQSELPDIVCSNGARARHSECDLKAGPHQKAECSHWSASAGSHQQATIEPA